MQRKYTQAFSDIKRRIRFGVFPLAALLCGFSFLYSQENDANVITYRHPLPLGEKLVFSLDWDPPWYMFFLPNMRAGNIEILIDKDAESEEPQILKIIFKAYSSGILAKLSGMKIDDDFVFLSGSDSLCTLNVSKKILEGKRKRRIDVQYLSDTGQLHMVEYDVSVTPPELKKDIMKDDIPSCVRDPFSALYDLRRKQIDSDTTFTYVIAYDDVIKEIESKVEGLEALNTTIGNIPAWKIQANAILGGLFKKGGKFKMWLSADDRKIPLQFEIKVPLGHVLGKLEEIKTVER